MIQVLIVADSRYFIQRAYALLEHYEDIALYVAFHSMDIFDAYLKYTPDIILIDHKIQLPLYAVLHYFETNHWNCLFFIDKKLDFLPPTAQTIFIDLEQEDLYALIQKHFHAQRHVALSDVISLYIVSPDGKDILQLQSDLYFVMMCISLSASKSPFHSALIEQIKNEVNTFGNIETFSVFEQDIIIVMRKSQMNSSAAFYEIYSVLCRITGICYSAIWEGHIPLERLEKICQKILSLSERCYCLGSKCYTLQEISELPASNDVMYFYSCFVQMIISFFEHDLKSFIKHIRDFYTNNIILSGNSVALECIREWLSFAEHSLFKRYILNKDFQYTCIYGSAERECDEIIRYWSEIFFKYDKIPYRPATVQALYCLLQNYNEHTFSLEEASREIQFSKTYMSRFVKEDTAQSFGNLLLSLRMQHSVILLKMTSKTIKDIALAVGYMDAQYFSKVFKKHTNMQPTDFRQYYQKRRLQ